MAKARVWSGLLILEIIAILLVVGFALFLFNNKTVVKKIPFLSPTLTPSPTPFTSYIVPIIPKKEVYRIVMVGDSETEALGIHGGKVSEVMNALFGSTPGHQRIIIDNYGKGGTNITQAEVQMESRDYSFPPLLSSDFDMILLESFGYNPLSDLGIENGQKKQTQTLLQLVQLLIKTHPSAAIVFVATIAPNRQTYAQEEGLTTLEARTAAANERMAYIRNHITFTNQYKFPLINVFSQSLTPEGDGKLVYINPTDHIHPSFAGIDFIANIIAHGVYDSNILSK